MVDDEGHDVEPGSGQVGVLALGGRIPLGYYKDEAKSAATFRVIDGDPLLGARRLRRGRGGRVDPPARPRLGLHQHRRREGLPRGGRGGHQSYGRLASLRGRAWTMSRSKRRATGWTNTASNCRCSGRLLHQLDAPHSTTREGTVYFAAKRRLFTELSLAIRPAVINLDSAEGRELAATCHARGQRVIGFPHGSGRRSS